MRAFEIGLLLMLSSPAMAETVEFDGIRAGMTVDELKAHLTTVIISEEKAAGDKDGNVDSPPYYFLTCKKDIVYSITKEISLAEFAKVGPQFMPILAKESFWVQTQGTDSSITKGIDTSVTMRVTQSKGGRFSIRINLYKDHYKFVVTREDKTLCQ